jgi:anti-anti-sigma regulatory factor
MLRVCVATTDAKGMVPTASAPTKEGAFEAEAHMEPPFLMARMAGTADITSQEQLSRFLIDLDRTARAASVSAVRIDMLAVAFVNSSSIGAFARWFADITEAGQAGYAVTLAFSGPLHRTRRAFVGMAQLFPFLRLEP